MSDPNTHPADPTPHPQLPDGGPAASVPGAVPDQQHVPASASTLPQQPAPHAAAPQRKLSTFLKVSIILLAGLTIASISLLFIGDFEGKFERVFSTFALFAVFVLFTALDTRREQKSEWYAPVALIANAYILGLLLIVIWMTPYDSFSLLWEIFWKSIFVILVTRLVILCAQLLLKVGTRHSDTITKFAFVTSVLAVLSGILFTAPVGIDAFDLHIPDMYWKIATAILILTALGLSITLLLRWFYGADERDAARARRLEQHAAAAAYRAEGGQTQPTQLRAQQLQTQTGVHPAPQSQPQPQQPAQPLAAPAPAAGQAPLLPWPTFSDGRPIPAGADGQPDFSVPGAPLPPHQQ